MVHSEAQSDSSGKLLVSLGTIDLGKIIAPIAASIIIGAAGMAWTTYITTKDLTYEVRELRGEGQIIKEDIKSIKDRLGALEKK